MKAVMAYLFSLKKAAKIPVSPAKMEKEKHGKNTRAVEINSL